MMPHVRTPIDPRALSCQDIDLYKIFAPFGPIAPRAGIKGRLLHFSWSLH